MLRAARYNHLGRWSRHEPRTQATEDDFNLTRPTRDTMEENDLATEDTRPTRATLEDDFDLTRPTRTTRETCEENAPLCSARCSVVLLCSSHTLFSSRSARETCEENRRSSMFSERTVELCCARGRSECAVQDLERAALCEKASVLCERNACPVRKNDL